MRIMKVLLTGSEGFVGTHLQQALFSYGYSVHLYDLEMGDDVRDTFKLDRLFEQEQFDIVINLAARAGVRRGEEFPEEYFSTNVVGLENLIKISEKYSVKKFVHFSSSSVYGYQNPNEATKEDAPKAPRSIYGITKLAGELLLKKSKLDYVIVRPFTIIGENGRKEMVVYKWLNQIRSGRKASFYGTGETFRGYTHINDIVDAVLRIIQSDVTKEDFNIGGHQKITLSELAQIFSEVYPRAEFEAMRMPESDQPYSLADTSKAQKMLDWKPETDIKKEIKELIS